MKKRIFLLALVCGIGLTACQPAAQPIETSEAETKTEVIANRPGGRPMEGQESFGLNVCEEVPKELVAKAVGKPIEATEDKSTGDGTQCTYYTNQADLEHVLIKVTYSAAETQKQGQEAIGRTVSTKSEIPLENFVATQEDGQINALYLVMSPDKFVRVDRTAKAADNEQLTELAKQVALIITGQ